jgi:hypothetical protein
VILEQIKITMAGLIKTVPAALLKQYESFGWRKVQGADPEVEKSNSQPTNNTNKGKKNAKVSQGQ